MAKKKVLDLKRDSRFKALRILREHEGFPVPPRKAVAQAKKQSKERGYLVAPYPGASPLELYQWGRHEWQKLGRWRTLAAPVALLVAAMTWEKEYALRKEAVVDRERVETRRVADKLAAKPQLKKRRKLLGVIPLPF